jgi:adenylate cyclase
MNYTSINIVSQIGDAIMILFNVPDPVPHHELLSVSTALEMHQRLKQLNIIWNRRQYPEVSIRIGINSGTCLVGNVGSERRLNYTALGDVVNIASRCESLNKHYNTSTIITDTTYLMVNSQFLCRWLSYVNLKGKALPTHVYEVICRRSDATELQLQLCEMHQRLKTYLENGEFELLALLCQNILQIEPDNNIAKEILDRLRDSSLTTDKIAFVLTSK